MSRKFPEERGRWVQLVEGTGNAEAMHWFAMNVEKGMRLDGVFDMGNLVERRSSDEVAEAVVLKSAEKEDGAI